MENGTANPAFESEENLETPKAEENESNEVKSLETNGQTVSPQNATIVVVEKDNSYIPKLPEFLVPKIIQDENWNLEKLENLLDSTLGFYAESRGLPCFPSTIMMSLHQKLGTQNQNSKIVKCFPKKHLNWLPPLACFPSFGSQEICVSIKDVDNNAEEQLLSFHYSPHIWCPVPSAMRESRLVTLFLPGSSNPIGYVNAGREVGLGSELHCNLTPAVKPHTRQAYIPGSPHSFKIETSSGKEIALGKVVTAPLLMNTEIKGMDWLRKWKGYEFQFVQGEEMSSGLRAVMLVTFLMWMIDTRERRQWTVMWSTFFVLFLIICYILIQCFGPVDE